MTERDLRPTPLDGWRVDLERLRRDHRGRRTFTGAQHVDDLELPSASVPDGRVTHTLDVDATTNDAVVTGSVAFSWRAPCRRCLEPVTGDEQVDIQEVFQVTPVDGETWPIVDDEVDLEPMVRDAVLLALPLAAVCAEDCAGPGGGYRVGVVDASPAPQEAPTPDPRWAALDQLDLGGEPGP